MLKGNGWLAGNALAAAAGCVEPDVTEAVQRFAAAECVVVNPGPLVEDDGQVGICHATSSATNPYVFIRVSVDACVHGHARHDGDFRSDSGLCWRLPPPCWPGEASACDEPIVDVLH